MFESDGVERAKQDLSEGRLWKARDRLGGVLAHRPADQEVLSLLGEVCFRMGDYPAAGRYWFLTERTGPEIDIAMSALAERYPKEEALGRELPIRAPIEAFPISVQNRLLDEQLMRHLNPQARMQLPKDHKGTYVRGYGDPLKPSRFGRFGGDLAKAIAGVVGVGGWIVGTVTVIRASDGFVLVPIAIAVIIAVVAIKTDESRRARRLRQLRERTVTTPKD